MGGIGEEVREATGATAGKVLRAIIRTVSSESLQKLTWGKDGISFSASSWERK